MGFAVDPAAVTARSDAFEVWNENEDALRAFLAVETQWNVEFTPVGPIRTGLSYIDVDVVLRRLNFPDHIFELLQIMELAALEAFNEVSA
ncbi:DUF1799 domain-containing protein [Ochrobactrum chromiisoli]|uniref:DUF1799 domain-containing protein n=1 Tax=Ochrobactrum chromiisoli TaxID=2993941 RepID=A0ABT3QN89_9HYPH|nr:DUF1799 domain-containing protein [Ochrobactrum chromiisoli]MCX2697074.1 DUF1799 domain-containing protein [Ochrobactrum chromiisoli]